MDDPKPKERWYEDGLPFSCTACGNCCKSHGEYSHVYMREEEVVAIAKSLAMDPSDFLKTHCVIQDGWITLRPDLPQCAFLDEKGLCGIYEVRPVQCRTWPFWDVNLKEETWKSDVTAICPGSRTGHIHGPDRVETIAQATEAWYEDELSEWPGLEPGDIEDI